MTKVDVLVLSLIAAVLTTLVVIELWSQMESKRFTRSQRIPPGLRGIGFAVPESRLRSDTFERKVPEPGGLPPALRSLPWLPEDASPASKVFRHPAPLGVLLQERRCGCQIRYIDEREVVYACPPHGRIGPVPRPSEDDTPPKVGSEPPPPHARRADDPCAAKDLPGGHHSPGERERAVSPPPHPPREVSSAEGFREARGTEGPARRLFRATGPRAGNGVEAARLLGLLDDSIAHWEGEMVGSFAQACVLGQLRRLRSAVVGEPFALSLREPLEDGAPDVA